MGTCETVQVKRDGKSVTINKADLQKSDVLFKEAKAKPETKKAKYNS